MKISKEHKYKILVWATVLLAILNISTLTTIYFGKKAATAGDTIVIDPGQTPLSGRYLREELNLNPDQLDYFLVKTREFRQSANEILHLLNYYKARQQEFIHRDLPDRASAKQYSDSIGYAHAMLKEATTDYYLNLYQKCTPEQQIRLREIFEPLFNDNSTPAGQGLRRSGRRINRNSVGN